MQVRDPSVPTPEGPKAASFTGTPSSSASTDSDRIARQSVGRAIDFVVGVGLGPGVPVASGAEGSDAAEEGVSLEPPASDIGPHAVNTAVRASRAAAGTSRAFMRTRYCGCGTQGERIAVRSVRSWRGTLGE